MKKGTQIPKLCDEIEKSSKSGGLRRSLTPSLLIRALGFLQANNLERLNTTLNIDESTIERDFIVALA